MLKKTAGMLSWIVVLQLIAFGIGHITQSNITTWYQTLHRSSLTPAAIVFPIVWSLLYIMIALAGWYLWQHRRAPQAKLPLLFYGIQMVLNWTWSLLFFKAHLLALSFFCLLLIAIFTLMTMITARHTYKLSSILLIPYLLWLIFAGYLNAMIWLLN